MQPWRGLRSLCESTSWRSNKLDEFPELLGICRREVGEVVAGRTLTVSSILLTVVALSRLLVVSNYQVPTATAVARSLGPLSTLTGTVLPLFGLLLPISALALAVAAFTLPVATVLGAVSSPLVVLLRLFVAAVVMTGATLFVSPSGLPRDAVLLDAATRTNSFFGWADYFTIGLLMPLILVTGYMRAHETGNFPWERYIMLCSLGSITLVFLVALVTHGYPLMNQLRELPTSSTRMWLPAERVTLGDGTTRVGYVLDAGGDWTTILWDNDRTVGILITDQVRARQVCRLGLPDPLPLISRAVSSPVLSECATGL